MNKAELEDDFLGGQGPLTSDEEKALGEYLKKRKNAKAFSSRSSCYKEKTKNERR